MAPAGMLGLREDLNDHDGLRKDSTLALLVGKQDLTGNTQEQRDLQALLFPLVVLLNAPAQRIEFGGK